ncbi:hypothetical protein ACE38V_17910 [Cytobacillus sp. Hz8]
MKRKETLLCVVLGALLEEKAKQPTNDKEKLQDLMADVKKRATTIV